MSFRAIYRCVAAYWTVTLLTLSFLPCSAQTQKTTTTQPARPQAQKAPAANPQRPATRGGTQAGPSNQPGIPPQQAPVNPAGPGSTDPKSQGRQWGTQQRQQPTGPQTQQRYGSQSALGVPSRQRTVGQTAANGTMRAPEVPAGQREPLGDGRSLIRAPGGKVYGIGRDNKVRDFSSPNVSGHWNLGGRLNVVRSSHNGTTTLVVHGAHGMHTIDTTRPDGTRIVNYGPHNGFVQQPIAGRPNFYSRTYVGHDGTARIAIFHSYTAVDGRVYYRYIPSAYYRPAFYGWAASPWGASVSYSWGAPAWGPVYGAYFTPYPVYSSANLWLTDYLLNANLQAAYAERQAVAADPAYYTADLGQVDPYPAQGYPPPQGQPAPDPSASPVVGNGELSPDVKTLISKQVGDYLANMQQVSAKVNSADASAVPAGFAGATPGALNPDISVFQLSTDMQLDVSANQNCLLTPGDVLLRKSTTPDANNRLPVVVVGSKPGDCQLNTSATMTVAALDEINNQTEQQLDAGLAEIAAKNGIGPLPASPTGATAKIQLASTKADPTAAQTMLNQNQQNGQQAEAELANTSAPLR